jgi:hypothetical protein
VCTASCGRAHRARFEGPAPPPRARRDPGRRAAPDAQVQECHTLSQPPTVDHMLQEWGTRLFYGTPAKGKKSPEGKLIVGAATVASTLVSAAKVRNFVRMAVRPKAKQVVVKISGGGKGMLAVLRTSATSAARTSPRSVAGGRRSSSRTSRVRSSQARRPLRTFGTTGARRAATSRTKATAKRRSTSCCRCRRARRRIWCSTRCGLSRRRPSTARSTYSFCTTTRIRRTCT